MQTADEIVSAIIRKWSAGFSKLDAAALASLYSTNAFFFGSNPTLYRGQEGVKAYFNALPRWSSPTVQFTEVRTAQVSPDLINFAGTANFDLGDEAPPLVGQDKLGHRTRGRRVAYRQPSRLVQDTADLAASRRCFVRDSNSAPPLGNTFFYPHSASVPLSHH